MNPQELLTDDGLAMLLLCSSFGAPQPAPPGAPVPFTLSEWNQLARKIHASSWKRPAGLTGQDTASLAGELQLAPDEAERITRLLDRSVTLLTPYAPAAGFSVGAAMGRNKVIYGLAELALVVSSEHEKGGTWAGAAEALKAAWCPVLVRATYDAPKGNRELLKKGALPLSEPRLPTAEEMKAARTMAGPPKPAEQDLFALREIPPLDKR